MVDIVLRHVEDSDLDSNGVFVVPQGVTTIDEHAFLWCSRKVRQIILPDSVTSIDTLAFGECEKLSKINIPVGAISISSDAFDGCVNLTEIEAGQERLNALLFQHSRAHGKKNFVECLLKQGADVNYYDFYCCMKPVHIAASSGNKDVLRLLIVYGADIEATCNYDTKDKDGNYIQVLATPLRIAVEEGHDIELIKLLIEEAGADISVLIDENGKLLDIPMDPNVAQYLEEITGLECDRPCHRRGMAIGEERDASTFKI